MVVDMPIEFTERFIRQYARLTQTIQRKVDKTLVFLDSDKNNRG
jgi:hypothetical protein